MKIICTVCSCEINKKHVYGDWDDYCSDCWESEGREAERWEDESEWSEDDESEWSEDDED